MAFKLDYSSLSSDENLNRFRRSNQIGMKNLNVTDELSVGSIKVKNNHVTTNTTNPVIYFDSQVNILQSAYTDDVDVIDIDKNTSFIDYRNLSKTYYTKIGGSNDEYVYKNNKCVDANNNLYIILESDSDFVNIFDSTNNTTPVADLPTSEEGDSQDVAIVKYNHLGEYQWSTHIGGYYAKFYPSLVCDNDGNIVVCFGNANGGDNDVKIYDTTDNNSPVATVTDAADDSAVIVKYDSNGVFLWTVHVDGIYTNGSPVLPRISCDTKGNIFLAHTLWGKQVKIYDKTPEDYIPLPTDFFIINHDNEDLKYTQPIFIYDTGVNDGYNFVTMKFDKNGLFKWINHTEMTNGTDFEPRCYIDNDIDGNIILTGNFVNLLKIFNPLNKTVTPNAKLPAEIRSEGYDNLFLIKYDPNGSLIWCTQVATNDDDVAEPNTVVDSNSNIYLSFRSYDNPIYLFDTDNKTTPKYDVNTKEGNNNLMIVKYNKNGVISWYTTVDGFGSKYITCLAIDNRFIKGNENSNIYLAGSFDNDLNFYNSTDITHKAYTLQYDVVNESENVFISCFDQDGLFSWATKAASAASYNYTNVFDAAVVADKDGHVYLMGGYGMMLNIYDAQSNNNPVATLTKANDNIYQDDVFIIKYNRYGLLNTSDPKLLYLEDNSNLPDSFCKEVILTNNDHNAIVNLQILKKENYGYSVRRNVLITEAIELITKGGLWIPKIIADQFEHVNDLDVIDTSTKTSFVNYENLQNTFYTKIDGISGGTGYTGYTGYYGQDGVLNPQIYLDKNDNVYMAGVYGSNEIGIYDFTNNTIPVGSLFLDGEQSLFLTKHDSVGTNQWYTRIGGYYAKSEPSVFANGNGDVFVTMQSYDDGTINIYDTKNKEYPAKTLDGFNSGDSNTIFVKYNTKGEFQWNIRMFSTNIGDGESFTSSAVVTGDLEGNLFVSGYFDGDSINVIDTGNDEVPIKIFTREDNGPGAYFICKFSYTGKFLWINHLEGGLIPNNGVSPFPDLFKFININLNTDVVGNLYLTSSFYEAVLIYNPDKTVIENVVFSQETNGVGIFTVKYNSSGIYQWYNGIFTDVSNGPFSGAIQSGSCVDADGNLYVTFSNVFLYDYAIFDTRTVSQPVYSYANETEQDSFISIVKFNHTGVFQWNNFIKSNENHYDSRIVFNPTITCDNQYTTGQYNPNIYVHLNGYVFDYRGGFDFFNASSNNVIAYTLPSKDYWMEDNTIHAILSKFDANGNFHWATTSAAYSYGTEYYVSATESCNVQVDSSGHVYIAGTYYNDDLYIWDVSTNGPNDNRVGQLSNAGNVDCYLVKYNKYGLINTNTHRDIYLEDVSNLPNAFEKSIVITNNTNNGPVNCQILEPLSAGFGYKSRRTITLTDCLDLISNNGKWIPKVQAEQISISTDLDVIDPNTKLSVLDYNELNQSSWTTTISGQGNEQNLRLSCDKDNNIYALCSFDSSNIDIWNNGGYSHFDRYSSSRNIAIIKYFDNGEFAWVTRLTFDTDFTGNPSIYTDAEGNSYVSVVKTNDHTFNNIYIFDIRESNVPVKSVSLDNNGASLIKYDKNGVYLWDIKIAARYNSTIGGTYGTNAVADKNGNIYFSGFVIEHDGIEVWDTSNSIKSEIYTYNGMSMFVIKFDKTGKYVWSIPLYDGVNTEDQTSLSCDQDGNVIISATQVNTVTINTLVDGAVRYYGVINRVTDSNISLFTVKYDTNGKCLWTNRLGSNAGGGASGEIFQPISTIDSYGNYYVAAKISGAYVYIYDTRNVDVIRFSIPIPTNGTYNTIFVKYNKNGIIQWYNFVSGYSSVPSICIDNKFTQGISDNSVYLCGSYSGSGNIVRLYNSANNGESPNETASLTAIANSIYTVKYNNDGYLEWCSKIGGSNDNINNSIVATNNGHLYVGGEFNTDSVNVYQGWTLGMDPNSNIATTISNYNDGEGGSSFDIFLVKYNRYGTVNNGAYRFGREIYLENDSSIPNGTEKSIVIINNNEYNGFRENVCLMILEKDYPGYDSFRNVWFSEGVSLISYDGQWFIKSSSGDTLPKRSIIMWGGDQTNIPRGWRLCDGGSLNNVTTPDLRGRFVLGYNNVALVSEGTPYDVNGGINARVGASLPVGTVNGEATHQLTVGEMPSHNHGVTDPGHNHTYVNNVNDQNTDNAFATETAADQLDLNQTTGSSTTGISINNTGGDQRHNNIPPFYVLAYIMKCF